MAKEKILIVVKTYPAISKNTLKHLVLPVLEKMVLGLDSILSPLNCKKRYKNEKTVLEKVKDKYFNNFAQTKDLHFFVGTTQQFHNIAKNPFIIIGTFHPPL